MSWDANKDVERLDTLGAYGRCTCCGLAVEVLGDIEIQEREKPRGLPEGVFGIVLPDNSGALISLSLFEEPAEFLELSEIGMCGCFDDWDQKVVWFVEQRFRDEERTFGLIKSCAERRLLGQCRSCGRAVERQAPWHWRNPKPSYLSSTVWSDASDTGTITESSPGSGSIESSGEAEPRVPFAYVRGTAFDELAARLRRLRDEHVEYDEAFARYVRLSDEQGACACYDDTEPQEAL